MIVQLNKNTLLNLKICMCLVWQENEWKGEKKENMWPFDLPATFHPSRLTGLEELVFYELVSKPLEKAISRLSIQRWNSALSVWLILSSPSPQTKAWQVGKLITCTIMQISQWAQHRQSNISQITQNSCAGNMKQQKLYIARNPTNSWV